MADMLAGRTIAFLVAPEGAEQVELADPWQAVVDAGATPRLVSTDPGEVQLFQHLDRGERRAVDETVHDTAAAVYDGLVLPGGVANPDILRTDPTAVSFVRSFFEAGKPVAVICHGPWTLIEARVLQGRTVTSWPSLRTDIENAGGTWVDREVVTCTSGTAPLISSRRPADLPAFCRTLVEQFADGSGGS